MELIGEFFGAFPEALASLWQFGRGWVGIGITVGSFGFAALLLLTAHRLRDTYGWVSAACGAMAAFIAIWWALGILPSAWVYYADQAKPILRDAIIPGRIVIGDYIVAANFYNVIRDSVVAVEQVVAVAGFCALGLYVQRRYPRALAEGEEARPQSGGYK